MHNIVHFLNTIRWQDVVDITLNSYILFRFYVLFRKTSVFRVLLVIAFLWFFQRIASFLGLVVTSWAIQGITTAAALIIIVVFRNEIRSVLQAKNLRTILWGVQYRSGKTPVDTIVDTVFNLAQTRCGALIVFPGNEDISEVTQTGIVWDGLVSREMIMSIFWHNNPVHDGAAVIRGDQITEVAVILPLSQRTDLPSHYGTRHRAAVGMAEATDALSVLVSEESGTVAVTKRNQIRTVNRKGDLARLIEEHIGGATGGWSQLKKEKLEIAAAAVCSVIFIVGVWFSFTRGQNSIITLDVPIEYMNRNPTMEIVDTSVNTEQLQLSGAGTLIKSLRPDQVQVTLDLGKAVAGANTFTITGDNVNLPPGIFLKRVEQPTVTVTMDITTRKEIPVQVNWVGRLPGDLLLKSARLTPDKVMVVGGAHVLKKISTIYTEKVMLNTIKASGALTASLVLKPMPLRIAGGKDKITIDYAVGKRTE